MEPAKPHSTLPDFSSDAGNQKLLFFIKKSIKKYADTNTDFLTPDQFKKFLEDNTNYQFSL